MGNKTAKCVLVLTFFSVLAGCAITTLYGKEAMPVQGEKNAYRYTIYFNMYTSKEDIEKRAHEVAEKLSAEKKCKGYKLEKILNTSFGAADVDYIARLRC